MVIKEAQHRGTKYILFYHLSKETKQQTSRTEPKVIGIRPHPRLAQPLPLAKLTFDCTTVYRAA